MICTAALPNFPSVLTPTYFSSQKNQVLVRMWPRNKQKIPNLYLNSDLRERVSAVFCTETTQQFDEISTEKEKINCKTIFVQPMCQYYENNPPKKLLPVERLVGCCVSDEASHHKIAWFFTENASMAAVCS